MKLDDDDGTKRRRQAILVVLSLRFEVVQDDRPCTIDVDFLFVQNFVFFGELSIKSVFKRFVKSEKERTFP